MDFVAFEKNFKAGKTQLLSTTVPGDLETPVSVALKLCGHDPYTFLLESVEGGETLGRYSIIGFECDYFWSYQDGDILEKKLNMPFPRKLESQETQASRSPFSRGKQFDDWSLIKTDTPLDHLRQTIKNCHIDVVDPALPPMAVSGLFGYLGYDMIRLYEDIPDNNPDPLGIPQALLMRPRVLAIFDNVKQQITLATTIFEHAGNSADVQAIYKKSSLLLNNALEKLSEKLDSQLIEKKTALTHPQTPQPDMTREQYHAFVNKAVDYIKDGEIFQVVPSQRFEIDFDLPSFELYRSLRRLNPSPFLFHIAFDGFALVGSSPEIMVRVRDQKVTIRPIAGTRKRGADAAEDKALAEDLLSDEKECAEHLMLLDLGRNDIGRVSEIGSVNVTEQFTIEHYSHVMHIVSNVEGILRDDLDMIDAFFSGFPAGTVSGAPKIRAMEIIDELESVKRSFYGGASGYFSGNGDMDTCINLRTGLVKGGKLYVQAGGGVVADSDPDSEYQETVNKAQALISAAQDALENSE